MSVEVSPVTSSRPSEQQQTVSVSPPPVPTADQQKAVEKTISSTTSVPSGASSSGGILGSGGRDRARKGRSKPSVSKVDVARKRREQKIQEEEAAEREKVLEAEKQRLALAEEDARVAAEAAMKLAKEKEEKEIAEEEGGEDESTTVQELQARPLTPHDVFPPPGDCGYFPCLAPSLSSAFEHAYDTAGSVSKAADSASNSTVVLQCEVPASAAQGSTPSQSDEWVYTLLTWLIDQQSNFEASIIGTTLTNGSTDFFGDGASRCLYIVLEGFVPTTNQFLGGSISQLLQSTTLMSVLPGLSFLGESATVGEVIKVLSTQESISVMHNIVTMPFSEGVECNKSIVAGANWMQRVNQNSITTCVFKDYFLAAAAPTKESYARNMKNAFATIEQSGLRLCGLRTAYVTATTYNRKTSPSSAESKYIHGSILSQPFSSASREDCHLVFVACFFSPRFVASEQLRNLLGPDDVLLAKRTDPSSIRALFSNVDEKKKQSTVGTARNSAAGVGDVKNVAFPMAIQAANCWKETLFWFGPRYSAPASGSSLTTTKSGNLCQSALVVPSERVMVLGVAVECVDSDFRSGDEKSIYQKASMVSNELASLQRDALKSVQGLTAGTMQLITFWSATSEEYMKYGLSCRGVGDNASNVTPVPASFFIFLFKTTCSDLHVKHLSSALTKASDRLSSHAVYWQTDMSLRMRKTFKRFSKPSLLQDVKSQIAHAETTSKLDSQDYERDDHGNASISQHLEEEDFDSHEDVGLQDVVIIAIPLVNHDDVSTANGVASGDKTASKVAGNFGPLIPPQELVLHLLAALPVVNYTTIIGVFSSLDNVNECINATPPDSSTASAAKRVYLCLRGFHLVETIGDALQLSIESISTAACMGGGLLPNISFDARAKLLRIPKVSDFKVLKGRRALDIVSKCFLNVDARGRTLNQHGDSHVLADQTNFMPFFAACDSHNFIPQCSLKNQISSSVQALFPPGRFTSLSVVIIPYPRDSGGKGVSTHSNGLFIKVFKKLEKAGFDIMSVSTNVVDASMAAFCSEHVQLTQASYGCSYEDGQRESKEWFDALEGQTVLSVVVAGNSALLRLQSVIGPFDTSLAQERYPLSISATLHQPPTSTAKASNLDPRSMRIFHSSTVAATDTMLSMFSNHQYSSADLLLASNAQSSSSQESGPVANLLSDFGSMECHTYQERYETVGSSRQVNGGGGGNVEPAVFVGLREISLAEHNAWAARGKESSYIISDISATSSSGVSTSNMDVTCIVLTSALLCRIGVSAVLQAVYKEGLRVVQARSQLLHTTVAKKLMDLAGQSSLSMKPSLPVLMAGPVLFLALEGNSHVILRLKSILQQPLAAGGSGMQALHMNVYNPRGLEDAKAAAGFGSSSSLGQLGNDEWGLLASSSSRLARDLLLYCFNAQSSQLVSSSVAIAVAPPHKPPTSPSAGSVSVHTATPSQTASSTASHSPGNQDDVSFRTPTGSPSGTGGLLGLGSVFNSRSTSPKFFTPPTSQKSAAVQREYEEVKGSPGSSQNTALEELD
mmetsp:Transcript_21765/g.36650  ORF Transcript_21765/g.36650 Transcript_21765/m.36650 type:complete len:1529 (+) Transcript_21765:1810-6396(+)